MRRKSRRWQQGKTIAEPRNAPLARRQERSGDERRRVQLA
jgi:hypothetical protein